MRLSITLQRCGPEKVFPINYQYELSSWIYHVLYQGDKEFATWLHDQGYQFEGKRFRLFGFSKLDFRPFGFREDRIIMHGEFATFELGFALPASAHHFLKGLFAQQEFSLGDRVSQVRLRVFSVEMVPTPSFIAYGTRFRAFSPVCVSRPQANGGAKYLAPEDPEYVARLCNNLLRRMKSYHQALGDFWTPPDYDPDLFQFELLTEPRQKLITIAAHTPQESKIKGYTYDFKLACDPSWMDFMWKSGLGEKNAQGFGFVGML